ELPNIDDLALDAMEADEDESRDILEILIERHRDGSIVVTSDRGHDDCLARFADPIRALAVVDPFRGVRERRSASDRRTQAGQLIQVRPPSSRKVGGGVLHRIGAHAREKPTTFPRGRPKAKALDAVELVSRVVAHPAPIEMDGSRTGG